MEFSRVLFRSRDGATDGAAFDLDSPTGTHAVEALGGGRYCIAMGAPRFEPSAIGLMGFHEARDEYDIAIDGDTRLRLGAVSTGNQIGRASGRAGGCPYGERQVVDAQVKK